MQIKQIKSKLPGAITNLVELKKAIEKVMQKHKNTHAS